MEQGRLSRLLRPRRLDRERAVLRRSWGLAVTRERAFGDYREWSARSPIPPESYRVDDQTWRDLEMDRLYASVDRTLTAPGRLALYQLLRRPTFSLSTLQERDRLIELLRQDRDLREAAQLALSRLGGTSRSETGLADLLWDEAPDLGGGLVATTLGLLAVASVWSAFHLGGLGVLAVAVLFAINGYLHQRTRIRHQETTSALLELATLLGVARRLSRIPHPGLEAHTSTLAIQVDSVRSLSAPLARLSAGRLVDLLYEYVSILFLLEVRALRVALMRLRRHRETLQRIFLAVGELDALQSAASFRSALKTWSKPQLATGATFLHMEDAVHPLLEGATANSIVLRGRGCLITGTNMAGKSTFLRTLGVNAVFSQTLFTCTCARYAASFLRVLSSMTIADSLAEGKSLYLAEAERLLAMIHSLGSDGPALCLVDELLAGTNVTDRSAASSAILAHVAAQNALAVAATHDPDLAEGLKGVLDSYHFNGADVDGSGVTHRLLPGITRARNAVPLLEKLGYPQEILDRLRGDVQRP